MSVKYGIAATILATIVFLSLAGSTALGAMPFPSYGSAVVDGNRTEWDLQKDFFAAMYRAGNPNKKVEAKLHLRYDCDTKTMYVLVYQVGDIPILREPENTAIKVLELGSQAQVDGNTGNDGVPPDFQWVEPYRDKRGREVARGFEASFRIQPGQYNIQVHANVFDSGGSQTASTGSGPNSRSVALSIECPEDPGSAALGDLVWEDLNGNGARDAGEPGISGVIVNLLDSTGTVLATTSTAANGLYGFAGLRAGNYMVEFIAPVGYTFAPNNSTGDETDSDVDLVTGRTALITLETGEIDPSWDAGLFRYALEVMKIEAAHEGTTPTLDLGAVNPGSTSSAYFWTKIYSNAPFRETYMWTDFSDGAHIVPADRMVLTVTDSAVTVEVPNGGVYPAAPAGNPPAVPAQWKRVDVNVRLKWNDPVGAYAGTLDIGVSQL